MRTKKSLFLVASVLVCCVVLVCVSASIEGGEKTYQVEPQIWTPQYRTDTARAVDAYERLMERYMDLTEGNLTRIDSEVRGVGEKLDSVDEKLSRLCQRLSRIEKALGIEQPTSFADKQLKTEETHKRVQKKSTKVSNR